MEYFNDISIGSYRGIKQLDIEKFSSVNIITGPNGSGKTSLLKGLNILSNPSDFSHYTKVSGKSFSEFLNSFDKRQPTPYAKLSGTLLHTPYSIEIFSHTPIINHTFQGHHRFSYYKDGVPKIMTSQISYSLSEQICSKNAPLIQFRLVSPTKTEICLRKIWEDETIKEKVLSFLSLYDEEIYDFHTDDFSEYFIYHQTYGTLTTDFFSEGIRHFLKIAEAFSNFSDGVLAIDGLEYQMAKNTIPELINFIYRIAKARHIQLFLVTQNAEIIDEWLDLLHFYNETEHLTIIRLRSEKEQTTCQLTPGIKAYQSRMEQQLDFRDE